MTHVDAPSSTMQRCTTKFQMDTEIWKAIVCWVDGEDPGSYAFIFAPTNRPTMLALSATTYEQVAVSPEIAMGCRRIKFL